MQPTTFIVDRFTSSGFIEVRKPNPCKPSFPSSDKQPGISSQLPPYLIHASVWVTCLVDVHEDKQ